MVAGEPINLAEFAHVRWWEGATPDEIRAHAIAADAAGVLRPMQATDGTWHLGLEWDEPRDVAGVAVTYVREVPPDLHLEYWQANWPTPAPERRTGARRGWIGRDDPWHGRWIVARAAREVVGDTCTFLLDPVDGPELRPWVSWDALEEAADYLAPFRRTLKVRLVSGGPDQPLIRRLKVTSGSHWRDGHVRVVHDSSKDTASSQAISASVTNGRILAIEQAEAGAAHLHVLFVGREAPTADRTILTIGGPFPTFSLLVGDLDRGPVYLPDYNVAVCWADAPISFEDLKRTRESAPRPIYERVSHEPEHSLTRAMAEIPPLDSEKQDSYMGLGRYLPLGIDGGRQEFALRHNGELFVAKSQLKLSGRDAARLLWAGQQMRFRFGTGDPPDFREAGHRTEQALLDGWLPVVISRWTDRELAFEETAFATLLGKPLRGSRDRHGDEDTVAMIRIVIRNTTHGRRRAHLWVDVVPQESVVLQEDLLFAEGRVVPDVPVTRQWRVDRYSSPRFRLAFSTYGRGTLATIPVAAEPQAPQAIPTGLLYSIDLAGGENHAVTLAIPFATPQTAADEAALASLDFDRELAGIRDYWGRKVASGGQMRVPEQVLADFHRAARTHVGITADKDPVNGLTVVPAATWSYGACGNEACWQITMLDQAGHHDQAEDYLETFLQTQGVHKPDGRFGSGEGALVAMDFDGGRPVMGGFAYNLDQGFIMECLADHYRYSGDRAWLDRVTPALIAACDFVARERGRTKQRDAHGDPVEAWGLLPAGHLEDNREWRHWFAVNAHAYAGLRAIADVLGEAGHPSAPGLRQEATDYRRDIRAAARQAMARSPVVRLLDGTYVPHVPTRTGIRGREWGWFREAAYGALHLLEGGVFDPTEDEVTWILKDLEDNLFVSREWGRPVDLERHWFSHGGVTIQANLMDLAIDYLRRGEVKHALRALFNNFGASLYPDVRTFTEHPVVELGHGVGPFYKSSDESKALIWLRHCLLHEDGDVLHLCKGAPRAWFAPEQSFGVRDMATFFGHVSYDVASTSKRTRVSLTRDIHHARAARLRSIVLRLRRPDGAAPAEVLINGVKLPAAAYDGETVTLAQPETTMDVEAIYRTLETQSV